MTVSADDFRAHFPEFASKTTYPDAQVEFYLDIGYKLTGVRWYDLRDYGVQLFAAHNLSLEFTAQSQGAAGGNPGDVAGPLTSGSVDKVSYGRNPSLGTDPSDGHWVLTSYGRRYIKLARMAGAGPVQIGVPGPDCYAGGNQAWPGPWYPIWPNPSNSG